MLGLLDRLSCLHGRGAVILLLSSFSSVWPASSHAQSASGTSLPGAYVAIKPTFGFGGSVGVSSSRHSAQRMNDAMDTVEVAAFDRSSDLEVSVGGAAQYLFSASRYFALGPLFTMQAWRSDVGREHGSGRSFAFDIAFVSQGRVPIGDRFEIYLSIPIGVCMSFLNEAPAWVELHAEQDSDLDHAQDVDPTYGFSFGLLVGGRVALAGSFGLFSEAGYVRRQFAHSVDVSFKLAGDDDDGSGINLSVEYITEQVGWNVGMFF